MRQKILGTELSPTANSTEGLVTVTTHDRQVMADAIRAGSRYLITSDVDDFAFDDLAAHGMSAVPHLAAQFAGAYDTRPVLADPDQPSTLFRGISCIRCEAHLDDAVGLQRGLCPEHLVR